MNKPVFTSALVSEGGALPHTIDFDRLLAAIAEGESERERERILPHEPIDLIKRARFGALRLPTGAGGGGSSIRKLFQAVIRLAEADANVAHMLRNHFSVVERLVRNPRDEQARQWQTAVA